MPPAAGPIMVVCLGSITGPGPGPSSWSRSIAAGMARPAPTLAGRAPGSALDSAGLAAPPRSILPSLLNAATPAGPDYPGALWEPANPDNYTVADRPYTNQVTRIIIHVAEGGWASTYTWFRNAAAEASANYVVSSTGRVAQMVPDTRHRLARRQLGLQRELDRDRARRLHQRHPVPRRPVPRIGQARRLDRGHVPDHARPHARDRPLPGARPEPPRRVGRRRPPHRPRPHLELAALHGLPARRRA